MMPQKNKIPRKYHPKGFEILYEDRDIIVGNKAPGFLTVKALWNKDQTVHSALNEYVRKGNSKSRKCVYVVHRLDQDTSGVMIFAKTPQAQDFLKDHWKDTIKIYYAVVHGRMAKKSGTISSYLVEDDEYMMHSTSDGENGKLAHTEYEVMKETQKFSLVKINLLTGRKNQIRVHLADEGHPVVGDPKYGKSSKPKRLALHSYSISFIHPFSQERLTFEAPVPEYFQRLVGPQ
ncbi:MAG: RluA family pseudouridine synthase [Candidatus Omnitrophica bacterium]|nr:RluA family pseudouridine synthase [Candidatus Omnitrophota bacterium]